MKFRPTPHLLTGIFMGILSLTTFNAMAEKAVKPYWQDVLVVEVNKEYPRTSFMTYNNRAERNLEILLRRLLQKASRQHY